MMGDLLNGDTRSVGQLSNKLEENENELRKVFSGSSDIIFRKIPSEKHAFALIVYTDGLIDTVELEHILIKPFTQNISLAQEQHQSSLRDTIKNGLFSAANISKTNQFSNTVNAILTGKAIVIIEDES